MALRASTEEPLACFLQDINGNGAIDPIVCSYIQGKRYPQPSRDELLDQVTSLLRKMFIRYADYADATIVGVACVASRDDDVVVAGEYRPRQAGVKAVAGHGPALVDQGFHVADFDGDGVAEVLTAGTFIPIVRNLAVVTRL